MLLSGGPAKVTSWAEVAGVHPMATPDDCELAEAIVKADAEVQVGLEGRRMRCMGVFRSRLVFGSGFVVDAAACGRVGGGMGGAHALCSHLAASSDQRGDWQQPLAAACLAPPGWHPVTHCAAQLSR